MRAVSRLTTCVIVLSLGLTAAAALAAPRQPPPRAVNANQGQTPPLAVAANRRQPPPPVVTAGLKSFPINTAGLLRERFQETTTGTKDPRTGQDLSKNANPGSGLPGGKDLSKEFPSGEKRWNDRLKGSLGGGSDCVGDGTPFDDKPGSNRVDDFLSRHGGNIPDPLAGQGKGRSGFSPADDAPGSGSVTVGQITMEDTRIICASDYVSPKDSGAKRDECIAVEYDRDGGFKTDVDRKMLIDFWRKWMPKGSSDQQYEGEGGYTGGGRSANDLYVGSAGRMTGKVPGGHDAGEAELGKDTGGRMPALVEAIGKYVAQGGRVHGGKAGYQGSDSGHGQDIGGAAEKRISGLKKATDAQRFSIDPNAPNPEEIPWWLREKVSPMGQASTAQVDAVQAGLAQGVAAQQEKAANTK